MATHSSVIQQMMAPTFEIPLGGYFCTVLGTVPATGNAKYFYRRNVVFACFVSGRHGDLKPPQNTKFRINISSGFHASNYPKDTGTETS